jgi:hypothetical protein
MQSVAGLILTLIAFGLIISWVTHGPGGPTRWARAKFLGRVA